MQERIHLLSNSSNVVHRPFTITTKPASFGVFLGLLNQPITDEEVRVLSQWDTVVLDYCEPGVLEAVSDDNVPLGPRIIARVDLKQIIKFSTKEEIDQSRAIYVISWIVQQTLRKPNERRYFTGVLVAGWCEHISTPLINGIAKLFAAYGLEVYLEVGPPNFLAGVEKLDYSLFNGLIVKNGTIKPDGTRRDFFDMDKMKTTTKAFVSQACQRPFLTFMWDTIENDRTVSHAIVRRAFMWCNYHGALPYFVQERALRDIQIVQSNEEPLAAFQWLKDRKVMTIHEKYRNTRIVSQPSSKNQLPPNSSTAGSWIFKHS